MWTIPGATLKHISNTSMGVRDKTLGLILHVQAGNGELTGWYDNPNSDASSAWQVRKDGQILQFGDPDVDKFWTQAAGNPDYGAVETEGFPSEPLTPEQIEGVAQIYAKGHVEEGWPFQLAEKPGGRGLGWHGMGGKAWGNHPYCPGDIRKAQRGAILARARQIAAGSGGSAPLQSEEDQMADLKIPNPGVGADRRPETLRYALASMWAYSYRTYQLTLAMSRKAGIDVDEKALAEEVATSLGPVLKDALTAEVAKGGSPEAIADAVVAKLGAALAKGAGQ